MNVKKYFFLPWYILCRANIPQIADLDKMPSPPSSSFPYGIKLNLPAPGINNVSLLCWNQPHIFIIHPPFSYRQHGGLSVLHVVVIVVDFESKPHGYFKLTQIELCFKNCF